MVIRKVRHLARRSHLIARLQILVDAPVDPPVIRDEGRGGRPDPIKDVRLPGQGRQQAQRTALPVQPRRIRIRTKLGQGTILRRPSLLPDSRARYSGRTSGLTNRVPCAPYPALVIKCDGRPQDGRHVAVRAPRNFARARMTAHLGRRHLRLLGHRREPRPTPRASAPLLTRIRNPGSAILRTAVSFPPPCAL